MTWVLVISLFFYGSDIPDQYVFGGLSEEQCIASKPRLPGMIERHGATSGTAHCVNTAE